MFGLTGGSVSRSMTPARSDNASEIVDSLMAVRSQGAYR